MARVIVTRRRTTRDKGADPPAADRVVDEYLASVPADRQALFRRLHALIVELYPHVRVDLSYRMPTYRVDAGWVALANQKHYVSLYTCGPHAIAQFKEKHPDVKTGKGCINFRPGKPLPLADLRRVVKRAIEHPKNG